MEIGEKYRVISFAFFVCLVAALPSACTSGVSDSGILEVVNKIPDSSNPTQVEFPLPYEPHYIHAFDLERWLIADHETLWITSTDGRNWVKTLMPPNVDGKPVNIHGVSYVLGSQVVVVTDDGLLKSFDYGKTWSEKRPLKLSANAVFFLNDRIGWVVSTKYSESGMDDAVADGQTGAVFRTDDGGDTWTECQILGDLKLSASLKNWSLSDIFVRASGQGLAVGDGVILSTEDGGITWKSESVKPYKYFKAGFSNGVDWVLSAGADFLSIRTKTDKEWRHIEVPRDNRDTIRFVHFIDKDNIVLAMNNLFRSRDGGRSWKRGEDQHYIFYVEELDRGRLIRLVETKGESIAQFSDDGGETWVSQS